MCCQQHLNEHFTLGHGFVRSTLEQLNRHRKVNENTQDNEFQIFFDFYKAGLFQLDRSLRELDPYDVADQIYDEPQERTWASNKLHDIIAAFSYPTTHSVDRDIVHPAAFQVAANRGQSVAPESIEDLLHDLGDAARFSTGAQIRTSELIDLLIERGEAGIRGYLSLGWDEGRYYGGGFYPTVEFRDRLQALSSGARAGFPGCVSQDFDFLQDPGEL